MPDSSHTKTSSHRLKGKAASDNGQLAVSSGPVTKEQEPTQSEQSDRVIGKIYETQKEADKQAEKEIQEAIGKEGRLKEPEIKIPPDVADAGVVSPDTEASEALLKDTTVDLPLTEDEYKSGEQAKKNEKVTQKKEGLGVASLIALALFVGRMIKLAHHHMKKIRFKKEGEEGK